MNIGTGNKLYEHREEIIRDSLLILCPDSFDKTIIDNIAKTLCKHSVHKKIEYGFKYEDRILTLTIYTFDGILKKGRQKYEIFWIGKNAIQGKYIIYKSKTLKQITNDLNVNKLEIA